MRRFQDNLGPIVRAAGHTLDARLNRTGSVEETRTVMTCRYSEVKAKACQAPTAR
jgi:hypothetical protein